MHRGWKKTFTPADRMRSNSVSPTSMAVLQATHLCVSLHRPAHTRLGLDSWQNAPFNNDTEPFANAGFVG